MKKRTAFIGAILSLIPIGQPLLIKTGFVLSSAGLVLSVPGKVNAESAAFYYNSGIDKYNANNFSGAISDYNKAIEINPNYSNAYLNRGVAKRKLKDYYGAISDYNKAIEIDPNDTDLYVNKSIEKEIIGDIEGACLDAKKAVFMGDKASDNKKWINDNC